MEIVKLNPKKYAGQKFTARYITNGYYDIVRTTGGFDIEYKRFDSPVERSFDDTFFGEWLDNLVAYGAFENGKLLGFVEGAPEGWNNRYRLSNICVFDCANRHCGIGSALMNAILCEAKESGARMIVLETQTCNENAILSIAKTGFS